MRALLDTNILIHREAAVVVVQNIGLLFKWLDRLHYELRRSRSTETARCARRFPRSFGRIRS